MARSKQVYTVSQELVKSKTMIDAIWYVRNSVKPMMKLEAAVQIAEAIRG